MMNFGPAMLFRAASSRHFLPSCAPIALNVSPAFTV
jgi:hypothetical protein